MHKRSIHCRDEVGRWDAGGGSMEFGETFEQAVRREVMEEYGTPILELAHIATNNVLRNNNGTPTHWIANIFSCRIDAKKVKNNDPQYIDEIGWFTEDAFPQPLHSKFLEHFEYIKKAGILKTKKTESSTRRRRGV